MLKQFTLLTFTVHHSGGMSHQYTVHKIDFVSFCIIVLGSSLIFKCSVILFCIQPDIRQKMMTLSQKCKKKCKVFPYSLPSVGPGADPGVQAVSPQVT